MNTRVYDVAIIGAGPAGTTLGTFLARAGLRVAILDRDQPPRFHIGESLMPETYWVFKRLGLLPALRASKFPRKYSVQFVSHRGKESVPFYFFETNPHESAVTWQVWRADFDAMLLNCAREAGVEFLGGYNVVDLIQEGDAVRGVQARSTANGDETLAVEAKLTVDASGLSALIARRFRLIETDPLLKKASIWTYYRGAHREPGIDEGATLILHTREKQAWFWYIPLPDDVVSVGVVSDRDYLLRSNRPEEIFQEEVANCPAIEWRLAKGRQFGPYYTVRDYSYSTRQPAGPGWLLVGDALGFVDPIYSSGVFLALKSGELAASAILSGFASGNLAPETIAAWVPAFKKGVQAIRRLVLAFYTKEFSFGAFVRRYPEHRKRLVDLLVGNVFNEDVHRIFDDMARMIPLPE